MTRNEMLRFVKNLQKQAERFQSCQIDLYLTEKGELRTKLTSESREYADGFFLLMSFCGKDERKAEDIVDSMPMWHFPDGFQNMKDMKDWYICDNFLEEAQND